MITNFPKIFSRKAISIYIASLAIVSVVFMSHMMAPLFLILGVAWVVLFFGLSSRYSKKWETIESRTFKIRVFVVALSLRVFWVLFSYVFFTLKTGIPFEFGSADALGYHDLAYWVSEMDWGNAIEYFKHVGVSDTGYPFYLFLLYRIFGPNIIITRLIKCLLSSWMCLIIYKFTSRNFGESVGRLAAIFCCLMPNLIFYCGLHLKETEMLFLTFLALERIDNMIKGKKVNFWNVVIVGLLIISLFFFRTVLGSVVFFSMVTSLVFTNSATTSRWNRIVLISWALLAVVVFAGGSISKEVQGYWNDRGSNQALKRSHQVNKGVVWAKYATGTVMAPMMFVLPFPTMVDVDGQYNQQLISGGNYVRNFLGIFVIITVFDAIFKRKNWRDFSLIGSYVVAYLAVICSSGFANSERFLLPGLPALLILAAYGVSIISGQNYKYVRIWFIIVPVIVVGWAVFKLGSRGIL